MKDIISKNKIQIIKCPKCNGEGFGICQECSGLGMVAWTGKVLLYWDKKINFFEIAKDKSLRLSGNIFNFALLLIGLTGAISLAWTAYNLVNVGLPFWDIFLVKNLTMFISS